jgi:tRNA A37 methylthiotransferase MiaB
MRSGELYLLTKEIAKKRNSLWKNWLGEIVIDEINGRVVQGRNYAYKPVVISHINGNISLGDKICVKVYDFSNFSLKGYPLS